MARPVVTQAERARKIDAATDELTAHVLSALSYSSSKGYGHPDTIAAWEVVETLGATIHRQSRFLAGKGKGG
jgi:hypothetical protein